MNTTVDINTIGREVERGLPDETRRIDKCRENIQIYHGCYVDAEMQSYYDRDGRAQRDLPLLAKVVDTLAGPTYRSAPMRAVEGSSTATAFLEKVYSKNRMQTLWTNAEKYVHASDLFALQAHATGDVDDPIRIFGWTNDCLSIWTDPEDQRVPIAVCTIDRYDGQKRYRLWTSDVVRTYITKKWNGETAGNRVAYMVDEQENPYGILPFTFCHYRLPAVDFFEGGIGDTLAQMHKHINFRLATMADHLRYSKPVPFLLGVDPTKPFPRNPRAGEFQRIGPTNIDAREDPIKPEAVWIAPPLDWVVKEWDDLKYYWNLTLESVGVPAATIPLGDALISHVSGETLRMLNQPLYLYAEQRQEQYRYHERDFAEVVLTVADKTYGGLSGALKDFALTVEFPEPEPFNPPDDPAALDALKSSGELSEIQVIQRRFKLTRDQAIEHLEQVLKDQQEIEALRSKYNVDTQPVQAPTPDTPSVPPPADSPQVSVKINTPSSTKA